jgi:hypothetical protein
LGVLGCVVGGVGFVTFVGGATLLARFRGDGLPGVVSLSKIPRDDALAVGADQLLALTVIPLAVAVTLAVTYAAARNAFPARHALRGAPLAIAGLGAIIFYLVHAEPPLASSQNQRLLFFSLLVVVLLGLGAAALLAERGLDNEDWTRSVWAFVGVVFVTGALVGALDSYSWNLTHPEARAFALARSGQSPIAGIFVAEDASFVYIGRVQVRACDKKNGVRATGRVLAVPRAGETQEAIGHFVSLEGAVRQEPVMLTQVAGKTAAARAPRDPLPPPCRHRG